MDGVCLYMCVCACIIMCVCMCVSMWCVCVCVCVCVCMHHHVSVHVCGRYVYVCVCVYTRKPHYQLLQTLNCLSNTKLAYPHFVPIYKPTHPSNPLTKITNTSPSLKDSKKSLQANHHNTCTHNSHYTHSE